MLRWTGRVQDKLHYGQCVTIIPRSLHQCTWWLTAALKLIAEKPNEAPAVAAFAHDAVNILEKITAAIPPEPVARRLATGAGARY